MDFDKQYLTYAEYLALGGKLAEMPFNLQEFKARQEINKYTYGRLINLQEQVKEVKICVYELIESFNSYNSQTTTSQNIASEHIGDYSVTYSSNSLTAEQTLTKQKEIEQGKYQIIYRNLINCLLEDGTPYLYRG